MTSKLSQSPSCSPKYLLVHLVSDEGGSLLQLSHTDGPDPKCHLGRRPEPWVNRSTLGYGGRDEKVFESLPQQACVLLHPTISISLVLKNNVVLGHCLSQRAAGPQGVWLSLSVSFQKLVYLRGSPKGENCLHRLHQSHTHVKHLPLPWAEIWSLGDQSHLSASESEEMLGRVVEYGRNGLEMRMGQGSSPCPSNYWLQPNTSRKCHQGLLCSLFPGH